VISKGKHTHCRKCYDAMRSVPAKICAICNTPVKAFRATYCRSCAQRQRRARQYAATLTPEQKHAMARKAIAGLRQHGYVKLRWLTKRRFLLSPPTDGEIVEADNDRTN
jgi:hypothetical protein